MAGWRARGDRLGHVGAQAAHALQVLVDVQQARDQPQVPGDRRLPRRGVGSPIRSRHDAWLTCRSRPTIRSAASASASASATPSDAQPGRRRAALAPCGRGRPGGRGGWSAPCRRLSAWPVPFIRSARVHQLPAVLRNGWAPRQGGKRVATRRAGGQTHSRQAAGADRSRRGDSGGDEVSTVAA